MTDKVNWEVFDINPYGDDDVTRTQFEQEYAKYDGTPSEFAGDLATRFEYSGMMCVIVEDWLKDYDERGKQMTEKVKVPKAFAEWISTNRSQELDTMAGKAEIIQKISECWLDPDQKDRSAGARWITKEYIQAIRAVLNGYEVDDIKWGFKLPDGHYVNVGIGLGDLATFDMEIHFVPLSHDELEFAQKYLKGEAVMEDEVDD